jgi:FlaA1/EpsC-like NDP-sugar epimerase
MAAAFLLTDVVSTNLAWIAAYILRFHSDLISVYLPVTKGVPAVSRYLLLLPMISVLWPVVLYFHGLYQVKRGRSRIDEFFAIVFSVLIASTLTLGATLYVRVYYRYQPDVAPLWEYSQGVFALFVVLDVAALNLGRAALRGYLQRMWAAGYNVKRVLIAGAGELGRHVAETILAHRELGYRLVGFVDDSRRPEYGPTPVLGTLAETMDVAAAHDGGQAMAAVAAGQAIDALDGVEALVDQSLVDQRQLVGGFDTALL